MVEMVEEDGRIPVGISSCLLGEPVRFDGGHRRDSYIVGTLSRVFRFVPFCPEVAIGLSVPRPTLRLVRVGAEVRVRGSHDPGFDVTSALEAVGQHQAEGHPELCGYIFKARSPSCGMARVPVYRGLGTESRPDKSGTGAFAQALMSRRPELPCEEEGRLGDPALRDNFLTRVFTFYRFRQAMVQGVSAAALLDFHRRHKLLLLAHHRPSLEVLGRMLADLDGRDLEAVAARYCATLMRALQYLATRPKHANVLMHLVGYLKKTLDRDDRAELLATIHAYRRGEVPLLVPLTLFNHHFRRHPHPYVAGQVYFAPYPAERLA